MPRACPARPAEGAARAARRAGRSSPPAAAARPRPAAPALEPARPRPSRRPRGRRPRRRIRSCRPGRPDHAHPFAPEDLPDLLGAKPRFTGPAVRSGTAAAPTFAGLSRSSTSESAPGRTHAPAAAPAAAARPGGDAAGTPLGHRPTPPAGSAAPGRTGPRCRRPLREGEEATPIARPGRFAVLVPARLPIAKNSGRRSGAAFALRHAAAAVRGFTRSPRWPASAPRAPACGVSFGRPAAAPRASGGLATEMTGPSAGHPPDRAPCGPRRPAVCPARPGSPCRRRPRSTAAALSAGVRPGRRATPMVTAPRRPAGRDGHGMRPGADRGGPAVFPQDVGAARGAVVAEEGFEPPTRGL